MQFFQMVLKHHTVPCGSSAAEGLLNSSYLVHICLACSCFASAKIKSLCEMVTFRHFLNKIQAFVALTEHLMIV